VQHDAYSRPHAATRARPVTANVIVNVGRGGLGNRIRVLSVHVVTEDPSAGPHGGNRTSWKEKLYCLTCHITVVPSGRGGPRVGSARLADSVWGKC
jgi:hypothetical protein